MRGFGVVEMGKLAWLERPDYECGDFDAILKPLAVAACSSDVHSGLEYPHLKDTILGHESLGTVIEVGKCVKDFKPGDRVIIPCTTPTWWHPDFQDTTHQDAGGMLQGINFSNYEDGTFAEQIKVRSADMNLAHLPETITLEQGVMITDMVTTGFHGPELGEIKYGDSVVVFGIGPVGLMAVAGSALRGAGKLIGVGTRPVCVELAKEYGATDIISYKEGDLGTQIMDLTHGRGVDCAIVAGGDAATLNTALAVTRPNGFLVNLNVFTGISKIEFDYLASGAGLMGHKTIRGGLCPGGRRRVERLVSIVEAGRFDPGKMVTHRFHGLEKIEDAFWLMAKKPRDLIKPVVFFE